MSHDAPIDALHRPSESMSMPDRLSKDEMAAFRQQFRALSEVVDAPLDDVADDCIPVSIGRFRIIHRLGSGSFGCVYLAYDSRLSRNVAVKVSHAGLHNGSETRARFISEAQAAARLAHPNIVCLHEYGEEQGLLTLVYEMCEGPTLEEWIANHDGPIPVRIAVGIIRELAKGLSHAHLRGLVHRDVKPKNILLTPNYDDQSWLPVTPRITDFGLARDWTGEVRQTQSARFVGSLDTMSPEQACGDEGNVTPAADQYSLGTIFYRMLTGVVPNAGDNVVDTLQRICNEQPQSPRSLRGEVSRDLEAIVMTCLDKRPESRYASCKELARDLDRFLRGEPVAARPLRSYQRAWRVVCAAPAVCSLAMAIVLGSLGSAVVFSLMASSLGRQQRELQHTLAELITSESKAIIARNETVKALQAVTQQKQLADEQRFLAVQQAYRADVHRAFEAWDKKQVLATMDMLDRINSSIRDVVEPCFGYRMLASQAQDVALRLSDHAAPATEVRHIPGTCLVVTAARDGRLNFHNVENGHLEHTLVPRPDASIDAMDVNRDGSMIVVGFNSPKMPAPCATVFALRPHHSEGWLGEPIATFISATTLESLRFSPCGRYLALGPRYKPVTLRELDSGKVLSRTASDIRNQSLDFSPDGENCWIANSSHEIMLTDSRTGAVNSAVASQHGRLQYFRSSPDGRWLAYATYNEPNVYLIETQGKGRRLTLNQPRGSIASLEFSADSLWLVAGTRRGGVATWSLKDLLVHRDNGEPYPEQLACTSEFVAHSGEVMSICVVEGNWLVSISDSGSTVRTPLARSSAQQLAADGTVATFVNSAATQQFVQGCRDGRVLLLGDDFKQTCQLVDAGPCAVTAIATSHDGRLAAIGWLDGRIAIVDVATRQAQMCGYAAPDDSLDERKINSLCFDSSGTHLAACGDDARVRVWKVGDGSQPLWEKQHNSYAHVTCFCGPDRLAVGGMFEEIIVYNVLTGDVDQRIAGVSRTVSLLYDPQRECLISGHGDGRLRIHLRILLGQGFQQVETLNGDAGEILSLAGSPDWSCYVSGDSQGHLKVWNAEHRELIGNLHTIPGGPELNSISLDSRRGEWFVFHTASNPADPAAESWLNCTLFSGR